MDGRDGDEAGPRLADVGEDGLLQRIFPLFDAGPADLVGPGDDAAVVAAPHGALVATTDALVGGLDWRDAWSTAADVGTKAVTQNVADVAAMGGIPLTLLVTLVADPATPLAWAVEMAGALAAAARSHGASVIGGDLSSASPGTLVVSVTVLGDLEGRPPVRRSGARSGDLVAVTGSLGLSGAGWRLLEAGVTEAGVGPHQDAVAAALTMHRRPVAPAGEGPAAARAGATAMIDVSDGLLRDAGRIARASGVAIDVRSSDLEPDLARIAPVIGEAGALDCVLHGGEEHSLLATFPGEVPSGWRVIGTVADGSGVSLDGEVVPAGGWDHFGG